MEITSYQFKYIGGAKDITETWHFEVCGTRLKTNGLSNTTQKSQIKQTKDITCHSLVDTVQCLSDNIALILFKNENSFNKLQAFSWYFLQMTVHFIVCLKCGIDCV